ncbi:hypothetical protein AAGS39_43900 [Flavobacterium sp. CGRL2]
MYLNCHSFHSLRYGTIPLDDLIRQTADCAVTAAALTDINTVTGIYDFIKGCEALGIKPLVGIEFRCRHKFRYIGLAKNASGLAQMNRFLTDHNFSGNPLPEKAPAFESVYFIYALENAPAELGENEYIGIQPDQLGRLFMPELKKRIFKMVVLQPVVFRTKREYNLHRILRAVDLNELLSKLDPDDCCRKSDMMIPESELIGLYKDYPEIIQNTRYIIDHCNFKYDFESPRNKKALYQK